ncbi:MAG: signal peptidase I [Porcipelethomonas sp.]
MDEQITEMTDAVQQEEEKKGSSLSDFMEIVESVIISVFVVLLVFTFICRPVTVDGTSMVPTLDNGDKLIMAMCGYSPKQGDIVIVENDASYVYGENGEILKGDPIPKTRQEMETEKTKRLIKRVIATGGQTIDIDFDAHTVTVDGELLYESYINDPTSRDLGAFSYPVTVPEGYIFVMGDNRNNSTDSRSPSVGFVKESDVLGKAVLRFYPFEKFESLS